MISAYPEHQPEDFQKGKIRVVLSNAKLIYGTSTPEGEQQSSAPEARTEECDPIGVYLKSTRTSGKEVQSVLCQKYTYKQS